MNLAKNDIRRMHAQLYCNWWTNDFKKVSIVVKLAENVMNYQINY